MIRVSLSKNLREEVDLENQNYRPHNNIKSGVTKIGPRNGFDGGGKRNQECLPCCSGKD